MLCRSDLLPKSGVCSPTAKNWSDKDANCGSPLGCFLSIHSAPSPFQSPTSFETYLAALRHCVPHAFLPEGSQAESQCESSPCVIFAHLGMGHPSRVKTEGSGSWMKAARLSSANASEGGGFWLHVQQGAMGVLLPIWLPGLGTTNTLSLPLPSSKHTSSSSVTQYFYTIL